MPGFTWYGYNRNVTHVRANKGSGGIGWLVKDSLLGNFSFEVIDKCYEGIMSLLIKHVNGFVTTLIGCYLPPENSVWGRNATGFFAHLITLLYQSINSDMVLLCGDFNSRISDKLDYIPEVDNVPFRKSIDQSNNKHGDLLIDFMKDTRTCTLNGRYDINSDDFTSISRRGKSVVDYIITPHECLRFCKSFKVIRCTDAVDKFNLQYLIHGRCKVPDHSILITNINMSYLQDGPNTSGNHNNEDQFTCTANNNSQFKRYCFDNVPDGFLKSPMWTKAILNIIEAQEILFQSQAFVDSAYDFFCSSLKAEMNKFLRYKQNGKQTMET